MLCMFGLVLCEGCCSKVVENIRVLCGCENSGSLLNNWWCLFSCGGVWWWNLMCLVMNLLLLISVSSLRNSSIRYLICWCSEVQFRQLMLRISFVVFFLISRCVVKLLERMCWKCMKLCSVFFRLCVDSSRQLIILSRCGFIVLFRCRLMLVLLVIVVSLVQNNGVLLCIRWLFRVGGGSGICWQMLWQMWVGLSLRVFRVLYNRCCNVVEWVRGLVDGLFCMVVFCD